MGVVHVDLKRKKGRKVAFLSVLYLWLILLKDPCKIFSFQDPGRIFKKSLRILEGSCPCRIIKDPSRIFTRAE